MGVDELAEGDDSAAQQAGLAAEPPNPAGGLHLRRFLKGCRPDWSWNSIATVVQKLAKVGVQEVAGLQECIQLGTLNSLLERAGEKRFNTETLELLRLGPRPRQKPVPVIDDVYRDFPEPRYFRVTVRCVAAQCSQRMDARKNMARCRGEIVEAVGRAGSWLRLSPIEAVMDGEPGDEPIWLQISSTTREDGRLAQEAETALLMLRGIYPEALGPAVDSREAEESGGVQLCTSVQEVKDVHARALHTQGIVKRCSNVVRPPLDDMAIEPRRFIEFFSPAVHAPGSGRLQACQELGARDRGLGRWRVLADRDYAAGEAIEECPLLTAACEAALDSVLDHRMLAADAASRTPRRLPLGLGCLYRHAEDEAEANARMLVRPDLGLAIVETTCKVSAGTELILSGAEVAKSSPALQPHQRLGAEWAAGSLRNLGLTAGAARLGHSPVHGRGVFAATAFQEGDVVELCPGLVLDEGSQGVFQDFAMLFFEHPQAEEEAARRGSVKAYFLQGVCVTGSARGAAKPISVIALGHGAMYNHKHPDNNMEWGWVEGFDLVEMRATRDIEEGEELFISYGANYWKDRRSPG